MLPAARKHGRTPPRWCRHRRQVQRRRRSGRRWDPDACPTTSIGLDRRSPCNLEYRASRRVRNRARLGDGQQVLVRAGRGGQPAGSGRPCSSNSTNQPQGSTDARKKSSNPTARAVAHAPDARPTPASSRGRALQYAVSVAEGVGHVGVGSRACSLLIGCGEPPAARATASSGDTNRGPHYGSVVVRRCRYVVACQICLSTSVGF